MPWKSDGIMKQVFETTVGVYSIHDSLSAENSGKLYGPDRDFMGQYLNKTYAMDDIWADVKRRSAQENTLTSG